MDLAHLTFQEAMVLGLGLLCVFIFLDLIAEIFLVFAIATCLMVFTFLAGPLGFVGALMVIILSFVRSFQPTRL